MKQNSPIVRIMTLMISLVVGCSTLAMAQTAKKLDPCSMLSKADIEAVIGQKAGDGKLTGSGNAAAGAPCQYMVGSGGVFSLVAKQAAPGETAAKVSEELKKRKIPVADAPGIGDRSFFSSPGYGMVQLNTFKGPYYLIVTLLIPGQSEAAQKKAASSLMTRALGKL